MCLITSDYSMSWLHIVTLLLEFTHTLNFALVSRAGLGLRPCDGICHCLWYETKCLLVVSRYLESQIQEGAGKEIRCPGHDCFKVVPNVSAWLNIYVVGYVTIISRGGPNTCEF